MFGPKILHFQQISLHNEYSWPFTPQLSSSCRVFSPENDKPAGEMKEKQFIMFEQDRAQTLRRITGQNLFIFIISTVTR